MTRPAGGIIAERRPDLLHHRAASESPQIDPRAHIPNPNPPLGTVGPNVADGFGDTHVMYPDGGWHADAWAGWPVEWATPPLEPGMPGEWSGFGFGRHSPDGYLSRVSTVMTAVDLNSRQLASFPIYGVRGYDPVRLPSWSQTPEPELYAAWDEFMKAATNTLQLAGETVLWATARGADNYPSRFAVLNPVRVEIDGVDGRLQYALDGEPLRSADVCHIKYQAVAGCARGVSPLEWLGRNLVSAAALERYASDIARNGVWAVLKHPANLNSKQADDLKLRWMAARQSFGSAPAVLSGGVEFDTLSLSPKDMALLDLRVYDEQRIAAAFGVPPFLIGLPQPGGLTYSNATSLFDFHWRATLRPMAQTIANAMSRWLLPRGVRFEFNRDEYVRPAFNERAQGYSTMGAIVDSEGRPAMTVDEMRIAERFVPYDTRDPNAPTGLLVG